MEKVDICIVVPKRDEFRCAQVVFGVTSPIDDLPCVSEERYPYARVNLAGLNVALILMDGQGNSAAAIITSLVRATFLPSHILFLGTAAGNRKRTRLGDVRFSERVVHINEWVHDQENEQIPRHEPRSLKNAIRRDIGTFVENTEVSDAYRQQLYGILSANFQGDAEEIMHEVDLRLDLAPVISGDLLAKNALAMRSIWRVDDRAEVYDMESGGLGAALDGDPELYWASIRGVSDLGDADKSSVPHGIREVASYAAAIAAKLFCVHGLNRSHPRTVRPNLVTAARLTGDQYYAENSSNQILAWVNERLGVQLPVNSLARHVTLHQFKQMLEAYGADPGHVQEEAEQIRQDYFRAKYLNYSYEDDLRGHFGGSQGPWVQEFREVLSRMGREHLGSSRVVDVGVSNGEELRDILLDAKEIVGVDIDGEMLEAASKVREGLKTVCASADDMHLLDSASFDLYVSLRTLVCRFIDARSAIGEALRLLKPGGLCVVSVPNGYREHRSGESVVVRGLKEPGGTDFVDPLRPQQVTLEYYQHMMAFGFKRIFVFSDLTDVYISGIKPGGDYVVSPRLPETTTD